jgi:hypothetical protein
MHGNALERLDANGVSSAAGAANLALPLPSDRNGWFQRMSRLDRALPNENVV